MVLADWDQSWRAGFWNLVGDVLFYSSFVSAV